MPSSLSTLLLSLAWLSSAAAAGPAWNELKDYSFEQFITDFALPFTPDQSDFSSRKVLFLNELERVRRHNAQEKGWKEGITKFSAYTPAELKGFKGRSKGVANAHKPLFQKQLPADFVMKPVSELPKSVDWRNSNIVSPVKDQGHCGSCWAFASTAVVESHVALNSGLLFDFSVQRTAMCAPNPDNCGGSGGCNGATAEIAFDYLAGAKGIFQEYQQGYDAYGGSNSACALPSGTPKATISGYVQLPENNYTALLNAIAAVGPIAVSVDANWGGYVSGIFNGCDPSKNVDIDHAVVLVGYGEENGEKYWLIRNSWSPSWGEKGYIRLHRSDDDDSNCATDSTPQDGTACTGDDTPKKVCGTCGVLYDSSYPTGAKAL